MSAREVLGNRILRDHRPSFVPRHRLNHWQAIDVPQGGRAHSPEVVLNSGSRNALMASMVLNDRLDIGLALGIASKARLDALNAVLEMITRRQCKGDDDLNLLAIDVKRALEYELNEAAEIRLHKWLAPCRPA